MKENKVEVLNKFGEKLIGLETTPSVQKDKYPAIILVHGFGVEKEEGGMFDRLAEVLSGKELEALVYRFDFSGCGESEGDYSETSLSKLKSDLFDILNFVKSQSKVDISRIGILGQSFGTSTLVSLEPDVKCIIMMGSIAHPNKLFENKLKWEKLDMDGISIKKKSSGKLIKIGPQFWKDFDNYNLLESIRKIDCPILFIHGSKDEKIPLSEMEEYYQNANGIKEKIILEEANHSLKPCREDMHKIVVDWFKKYLF